MPYHLFEVFGVELEYMIVDADTLSVRPITDEVIHDVAGEYVSDVERGDISWSNELALHVIELKTTDPASELAPLANRFQDSVNQINTLLARRNARLMPTAMHPWMEPFAELKLWPHEYNPVYEALHRIFDCRGHGYANLQSVHLNLPFADADEFGRLHTAIRLLLPILPALAASSPVEEGRVTGVLDNRMKHYRKNSAIIPRVSGHVVPEPVFTPEDYEMQILQPLYRDIAPHDPGGILQFEWLNARGAIARFNRNAIEIRVLDLQECPEADLAICGLSRAVLQAMVEQRWTDTARQQAFSAEALAAILAQCVRDAEAAIITDADFLRQFGLSQSSCNARELWQHLRTLLDSDLKPWREPLDNMLNQGSLARRILKAIGTQPSQEKLIEVYGQLCQCLAEGRMFLPG